MQRRYITTDVFTDRIFGGNPLAVVLDAEGLTTSQMQAIATEFNYSETTFVLPPQHVGHTAHVRIFTSRIAPDSVAEAQKIFAELAAGGNVTMAMQPSFGAKSFGMPVDKFGTPWIVNGELLSH